MAKILIRLILHDKSYNSKACQHSPLRGIYDVQPTWESRAFSGSLCGLKLVPSKQRYLVPPTSTPKGHNANRWAV